MPVSPLPFLAFLSGALALDNAPALCDDKSEGWMRYGELRDTLKNLIPFWTAQGHNHQRGLVLCAAPRTLSGVLAYFSAATAGHAILMIDAGAPRPDQFISAYEPDWILLPHALKPEGPYNPVDWPLSDLYLWRRDSLAEPFVHDDLFLLLLPPGPPEAIKSVRLSYEAVAHNTQASVESLGLTEKTRPLLNMPLAYSFGLSLLHMTLAVGGSLVLSERDMKNRELWDQVQKRDVTLFAGIPFHYEYLARAGIDNLRVPRLKTFLQAGGRMSLERTQEILRQVTLRNGELFILYGLTEASPRISFLPLHLMPQKIGSLGQPMKDGRLTQEDDHITYHGPNVMMGYAQGRADLALGDTQRGILPLPEPGRLDEDGFLYLGSGP